MKVTIHPTTKIVLLNDLPARIWEGLTDTGIACHAYIPLIAVDEKENTAEFDRELKTVMKPSARIEAIPFRLIL